MFFEQKYYPLNAIALEDSSVIRINNDDYLNVLKKSPKLCFQVMAIFSQRLHKMLLEINNLSLHDGRYKLITFLLNHTQQQEDGSIKVHLPVAKNILAQRLSIQPETLSRIFKSLSKQDLITVNNRHIILLKPIELKNMIDF
jgi:CRP-like cAMP-binding protein